MKKITFLEASLLQGGAERVVSILSKEFAEKEELSVEILLWYAIPPFYEIDPRVKLTYIEEEADSSQFIKKLLWLHRYMKKNTDIVLSFLAPINMIGIVAHFFSGTPIIVADRNDPSKVPVKFILRKCRDFLYMFSEGIVVQTQKNKEYFNKIVQKKSKVIYNPIDLREKAGSAIENQKTKKIVSVGRLMPQKNQGMLFNAFANFSKAHPEYQLIIYGEGPLRKRLEELAASLGIKEKVQMPGSVKDLHEKIKDAELFVLSSDYEGMPNALIEAMCLGLPVISTKVSGATDLIVNDENGILVEIGNVKELERAMFELIEDENKANKLAYNAIRLNQQLEISRISDQWLDFVKEFIHEDSVLH